MIVEGISYYTKKHRNRGAMGNSLLDFKCTWVLSDLTTRTPVDLRPFKGILKPYKGISCTIVPAINLLVIFLLRFSAFSASYAHSLCTSSRRLDLRVCVCVCVLEKGGGREGGSV